VRLAYALPLPDSRISPDAGDWMQTAWSIARGDGFSGGNTPLAQVAPLVRQIRAAADAAGRDPAGLHIVCRGSFVLHDSPQGKDRRPLWGTLDEIREDVQRYAAEGLTELFLEANFDPRGPSLERALRVMEALAPAGTR